MGASLVVKAFTHWSHVSDRAFRVLLRMAVTALDKPRDGKPAKVYFAGRELLAMSLRTGGGTDRSRHRAVARAIAELADAGAIERIGNGRTGHNAEFRLTLDRANQDGQIDHPPKPRKRRPKDGQIDHPKDGQISHPKDGQFVLIRVAESATPRNNEEPLQELKEEEGVQPAPTSHPPRVPAPGTGNVIPFVSKKPDPDLERRARSRVAGVAALAASAEKVRTRAADIQARIDARKETS